MSDVIIIGAGPAGSALGCYLSAAGISNTIIEKANHPRPHVGESLVMVTTRVFQDIDFLETMEREGFVKKYGASWHAPSSTGKLAIRFAEFPQDGIDQEYTYHVDRSRFDLLLLKHAEKLGSTVYQGVPVTRLLVDDNGRTCGVRVKVGDQQVDLSAKIVVDASGRDTFIGRHFQLKVKDPLFNQYAIHAWYEQVDRGEHEDDDYIHIYFLPIEKGWVWQIPITETVTSVGVVTERQDFLKAGMDMEGFFNSHIHTSPNLAHAMRSARRVTDFRAEGDYSYTLKRFVGDGYLIIGDAARFVDPIFSSGVSVALHSAKFASECILAAFEQNDFSESIFLPYERRMRAGVEIWYEFIRLYYKLLPLFTHFIRKPQYRMQLFQLLQGEVFDREEVPVLKAMRDYIEKVEQLDSHLFREQLLNIPVDQPPPAGEPAVGLGAA